MSTQAKRQVVEVEQSGPLRSIGMFIVGYVSGRVALVVTLTALGIFIGTSGHEAAPVRAEREKVAARQQEVLLQDAQQKEAQQAYEADTGHRFP